jgi:hypothetical protein
LREQYDVDFDTNRITCPLSIFAANVQAYLAVYGNRLRAG